MFSYALGSKCANFQQKINCTGGMSQTLDRVLCVAKLGSWCLRRSAACDWCDFLLKIGTFAN